MQLTPDQILAISFVEKNFHLDQPEPGIDNIVGRQLFRFVKETGMAPIDAAYIHWLIGVSVKAEILRMTAPSKTIYRTQKAFDEECSRRDRLNEKAGQAVEKMAHSHGLGICWPGLYPTFEKNGRSIYPVCEMCPQEPGEED